MPPAFDWKTKFSFLDSDSLAVEHHIGAVRKSTPDPDPTKPPVISYEGGEKLKFWPVSVATAFRLKSVAVPLVNAIMVLCQTATSDTKSVQRTLPSLPGEPAITEFESEAISPALAELRDKQRRGAIDEAMRALTDDASIAAIGMLLQDSLRDAFPRIERQNWPPADVWAKELPITILPDMLVGVAKANKGVFGPLTHALEGMGEKAGKWLADKAVTALADAAAKGQASTQTSPTDSTPGSSSRIASSGSASTIPTSPSPAVSPTSSTSVSTNSTPSTPPADASKPSGETTTVSNP